MDPNSSSGLQPLRRSPDRHVCASTTSPSPVIASGPVSSEIELDEPDEPNDESDEDEPAEDTDDFVSAADFLLQYGE